MDAGQKVTGNYLGHTFTGVITERRFLTVRTDGCVEHFVTLDAPLQVFGRVADTLVLHTLYDGAPSSYTRYSDWMKPV